jgi:Large polyvalent protein-associated domain 7
VSTEDATSSAGSDAKNGRSGQPSPPPEAPRIDVNSIEATLLRVRTVDSEPATDPITEPTSSARSRGRPEARTPAESEADRSGDLSARRGAGGTAGSPVDLESIPQEVRVRFVNLGQKYFLPDGELAFQDHGHKLTTASENTEIVRSLIAIARARQWQDITVSGTESFRRSAWQQAITAGLLVRGYTPSALEEAQLARTLGRRTGAAAERDIGEHGQGESRAPGAVPAAHTVPSRAAPPRPKERLVFGELLDHGRENFQFNPHEDISYFVKIKTDQGHEMVWGKDLERALRQSKTQPQIGERIGVRQIGQEPVTVQARERDSAGHVIREQPLKTHRNAWLVETEGFFTEREEAAQTLRDLRIAPGRALESHPQLVGTYLAVGAAEKLAAQRFADPEDRRRFVAIAREALADAIQRGEPLLSPKLREGTRVASRRPDSPTRAVPAVRVPG